MPYLALVRIIVTVPRAALYERFHVEGDGVLERLLDDLSFEAGDAATNPVSIDAKFVDDKLAELAQDQDLSRFIL